MRKDYIVQSVNESRTTDGRAQNVTIVPATVGTSYPSITLPVPQDELDAFGPNDRVTLTVELT